MDNNERDIRDSDIIFMRDNIFVDDYYSTPGESVNMSNNLNRIADMARDGRDYRDLLLAIIRRLRDTSPFFRNIAVSSWALNYHEDAEINSFISEWCSDAVPLCEILYQATSKLDLFEEINYHNDYTYKEGDENE